MYIWEGLIRYYTLIHRYQIVMATGHYYWASIFHLMIILISTHLIQSQAFDFFYFVQQVKFLLYMITTLREFAKG